MNATAEGRRARFIDALRLAGVRYWTASLLPAVVGTTLPLWLRPAGYTLHLEGALEFLAVALLMHAGFSLLKARLERGAGRAGPRRRLLAASLGCVLLACVLGLHLSRSAGGAIFLIFGAATILSGLLYVAPPARLSQHAGGEVVVAMSLSFLPLLGAYLVQTGDLTRPVYIAALPIYAATGLWVWMERLESLGRHTAGDRKTLATMFGARFSGRVVTPAISLALYGALALAVLSASVPKLALAALLLSGIVWRAVTLARKYYQDASQMARARGAAFFVHFGVCAVLAGSSVGTTFTAERPASGDVEAVAASQPDQRELDRIATLGYIAGRTPAGADVGVVVNNAAATFDGYTLFTYAKGPEAVLIDMDGNVLRSWSKPGSDYWARARLLPDGDLLVITCDPYRLTKLNLASETIWTYEKPAHHDFQVQEDGSIWVLTRSATSRESIHQGTWLLDDVLVHLDSWGRELSHVSLLEAFERSGEHARWVLESVLPDGPDIFHTNSLEIHDAGRRALVSIRELDIIAMVDLENGVTEWVCEGPWHKQHEARLLDGTALLFDNLGLGDQSRVLEFDCSAGEITWQYTAPGFLSKGAGAAQRLGNGNILITESESGRILEVDREGTTVWEYVTPLTVPGRPDLGLGIMRAERLARGIVPVSVCGAR